jgi:hypothetical protein
MSPIKCGELGPPFPLFGTRLCGNAPHRFDLSSRNLAVQRVDWSDPRASTAYVFGELARHGRSWGIGSYGEERAALLRAFPQMVLSGRVIHCGLDLILPAGSLVFAPLPGRVFAAGFEDGPGNYGSYVVLRHESNGVGWYTLYGHLSRPHLVRPDQVIAAGDRLGALGGAEDNGGWFPHLHLQRITERAVRAGRMLHGYLAAGEPIVQLFPNPAIVFRRECQIGQVTPFSGAADHRTTCAGPDAIDCVTDCHVDAR